MTDIELRQMILEFLKKVSVDFEIVILPTVTKEFFDISDSRITYALVDGAVKGYSIPPDANFVLENKDLYVEIILVEEYIDRMSIKELFDFFNMTAKYVLNPEMGYAIPKDVFNPYEYIAFIKIINQKFMELIP